jgi:hypothetical protein
MSLQRSDPKDKALANSLIKCFDRGKFQKLIVKWIVENQQSFKQVEHPRLLEDTAMIALGTGAPSMYVCIFSVRAGRVAGKVP